jgi:hypothetical protein
MIRAQIASSVSASAAVRFSIGSRGAVASPRRRVGRRLFGGTGVDGIVSAAPAMPARLRDRVGNAFLRQPWRAA